MTDTDPDTADEQNEKVQTMTEMIRAMRAPVPKAERDAAMHARLFGTPSTTDDTKPAA